jgi:hypothetical protein
MTGIEALALIKHGFTLRRKAWDDAKKCKSIDFLDKLYIHFVKPIVPPEEIDEKLETLFSSDGKIEFKEQTFSDFLGSVDAGEFLYDDWEIVE